MPDSNPAFRELRGLTPPQEGSEKPEALWKMAKASAAGCAGNYGIGVAAELPCRKLPAFLPEIKPAEQKQAFHTCWNSEPLTCH
jgi:hypothetical protein